MVSQTVTQLAAAALRRVGVAAVAAANLPTDTNTVSVATIAQLALNRLGVNPFALQEEADAATIITVQDIASGALRMCGANLQTAASLPGFSTDVQSTVTLAPRLLVRLGIYASDEAASTTDLAVATNALLQVQNGLVALALVTWADGAIPALASELYITMATYLAGPSFGKQVPLSEYQAALQIFQQMALSGQNVETWAEDLVLSIQQEMQAVNGVAWLETAIPYAVGRPYMVLVADAIAPTFGKPRNPPDVAEAKARIREVALSGAFGQALATTEVTNLHGELIGLAIVSWPITAIPDSVADAYALAVSARLAPLYDKPRDEVAIQTAFSEVRRIALLLGAQGLAEGIVREIHAEWRQRNMTRWELFDIPREAEESYIGAAGARLAPQFQGALVIPNAMMMAETGIYRIISLATSGARVQAEYF